MSVALLADASVSKGIGHVMRCLTLGRGLRKAGAKVHLISTQFPVRLKDRASAFGVSVLDLTLSHRDDHVLALLGDLSPHVVVRDSYDYSVELSDALRSRRWLLVALDDGTGVNLGEPELVINSNPGVTENDYRKQGCESDLMLGLDFLLLRDEVRKMKKVDYLRRPKDNCVLMFGGGAMPEFAREVEAMLLDYGMSVSSIPGFFDSENWVDPLEVAQRISMASIAITAAGGSLWECAFLNTPAIAIPVANNQVAIAAECEKVGFTTILQAEIPDISEVVARKVQELANNEMNRLQMSQSCGGLIDGLGTDRVVQGILDRLT